MNDFKPILNGGMDLDTAYSMLPKNKYVRALNITHDAFDESHDEILTNIVSNRLVSFNYVGGGTSKVIGAFPFNLRGTIIFFRYNSLGYNGIYEYDRSSHSITKIFQSLVDSATDILGFTATGKITSVNIFPRDEGDLLYFIDSLGRPTGFDITAFKAGEYTSVTRDIIDVCKRPVLSPPSCIYGNDTTRRSNSTRNKLFRFKTRLVYDDLAKSVCSPISSIPLPVKILDSTYTNVITNNNVINLSLYSGDKDVKKIELLMSYVDKTNNWSDFALVESIDKTTVGLSSTTSPLVGAGTTRMIINFSGYVAVGTVINIYLTLLSGPTQTLIGTYTTIQGDTISSIITGLITSITGIGIGTTPSVYGSTGLYFEFNNILYSFDEVQITPVNTDNDNINFPYAFYNDGTYPVIDIKESIQLFDFVPELANCQELFNGNVLGYGGITEGYDRDLLPNVVNQVLTIAAGSGTGTGSLNGVVAITSETFALQTFTVSFTGIPAVGTLIEVRIRFSSDSSIHIAATYTTIAGDTATSVAAAIAASFNSIGLIVSASSSGSVVTAITVITKKYYSLTVTPPATSASINSIPTWPFSVGREIGLVYYDKKGKTNGVLYSSRLTFPAYSESGGSVMVPYVNTKIYHTPPDWAYSFQIVFTKEPTKFIYWHTTNSVRSDATYYYFDITNIDLNAEKNPTVSSVLNYSFSDGDRMRLIRNMNTNDVYPDTYDSAIEGQVENPEINSVAVTGVFIKIKKVSPFTIINYSTDFFVIQLYSPAQQLPSGTNKTFYECAQQYPVLNPGTDNRVHGGMVTDQDVTTGTPAEFNIYNGDAYFRQRTVYLSQSGFGTYNCLDRNFVDFYTSAVNDIDGRPSVIDVNAKRAFYGSMGRHGQAYQPNTNINGLPRFYDDDFFEVNAAYGEIKRFSARDKMIRVFQQFKTGQLPLYNEIVKDATGRNSLLVSTKLVNPIQYYVGDFGIGDNSESLASHNFADYFTTNIKGAICRLSNDGIQVLSILYKVNSFATAQLPSRTGQYKVYGAFDQRLSNYIIALEATNTDPYYTLVFDEKNNTFETFWSLPTEMMCCLGTLFVSFSGGNLYTHDGSTFNQFYGVKYPSNISLIFNKDNPIKKKFNAIGYQSKNNKVWASPFIETNTVNPQTQLKQQSSLKEVDFVLEESVLTSALLRDKNSMSDERLALLEGDYLGGNYILVNLEVSAKNANDLVSLVQPYLSYEISQRNF